MSERYIENTYNDVVALIASYSHLYPDHGLTLVQELVEVHDIPEIGERIFEEEVYDIELILKILKSKANQLSIEEVQILEKAEFLLSEIKTKKQIADSHGFVGAKNSAATDLNTLRRICNERQYEKSIDLLEASIKQAFENSADGTAESAYLDVEDKLLNVYNTALVTEGLSDEAKDQIMLLIFDLADNLSPDVGRHLIESERKFARKDVG